MYEIYVTDLAHKDLDSILSYITTQLTALSVASEFADEVEKCYGNLKNNPRMYEQLRDARLKKEGYRRAVVKNYILIYKIDESEKRVNIYRIVYGARDYEKLL